MLPASEGAVNCDRTAQDGMRWGRVKEDGTRVGDAGDAGSQRISLAMPSIKIVF